MHAPSPPTPRARLAAALLAAGAAAGCSPGSPGSHGGGAGGSAPRARHAVLIVIDTLRRDHLSAYGHARATSPNLDRFAAGALRYDGALAHAPWTTPSIGALLTSQYPSALGIESERSALAQDLELLPEVLDAAGFVTAGVVSHSFCSSAWGFAQGFDAFDESQVQGHAAVTSEGVTERALAFLDEHGDGREPFFLFVHYFDPHCAYVEHPEHAFGGPGAYDGPVASGQLFRRLLRLLPELGPADAEELRRLYDSEIAYTDAQVGRLLERLERDGRLEDTLVVITADHGEEFLDHGRLGHAKTLHAELLDVPLLVRVPGVAPGAVREPVGLVDVYPTVLEALGIAPPPDLAGVSILPGAGRLDPGRVLFAETARSGSAAAAISATHKLVVLDRRGREELYDRAADPAEARPLPADDPAAAPLRAALERWRAEVGASGRRAPEVAIDAAEARRLGELGYAGEEGDGDGDGDGARGDDTHGDDPGGGG